SFCPRCATSICVLCSACVAHHLLRGADYRYYLCKNNRRAFGACFFPTKRANVIHYFLCLLPKSPACPIILLGLPPARDSCSPHTSLLTAPHHCESCTTCTTASVESIIQKIYLLDPH
ncbi:unnamed protein product, partial [Ectocarpus sp. 4 AP-2014]